MHNKRQDGESKVAGSHLSPESGPAADFGKWMPGHKVTPLFEGAETFAALEQAIQEARHSVHMAYWLLDPLMGTVAEHGDGGPRHWEELLEKTLQRQVSVRIILADFDPVLAFEHHKQTYAAYRRFADIGAGASRAQQGLLQVITARHPARVGLPIQLIAHPFTSRRLKKVLSTLNATLERDGEEAALALFGLLPGLWERIDVSGRRFEARPHPIPIYLASHHEKTCIIDGRTVFLGGLDVERERYDTQAHDSPKPWHDIACRLEGPAAAVFERRFRRRWNLELERFRSFKGALTAPKGVAPMPTVTGLDSFVAEQGPTVGPVGATEVRPLQTYTEGRSGLFHRTARPVMSQIAGFFRDAIAASNSFIYIETQYLRVPGLARLIVERARQVPRLRVIILLPLVPQEIVGESDPDMASQHGQYLEAQAVTLLRRGLGEACGVYTLLRNGPAPQAARAEAKLYGSDMVYVHAKTAIFDDRVAIVGSANLNGRSFWCDTETAVAWRGDALVRNYRLDLWERLLACRADDWPAEAFVRRWAVIAESNSRAPAGQRQGFVVPLTREKLSRCARWHWIIPDEGV